MKVIFAVFLVVLAVALAEPRIQQRRGLTTAEDTELIGKHPYLFLSVPRGRSGSVLQGFEVIQEDDDDEKLNDDDDSAEIADDDDDDDDNEDDDDEIEGIEQKGSLRAVLNEDDLDDDDNDDDNDEESSETDNVKATMNNKKATPAASNLQMILQNAKPTQMMVSKEHAGAIMVPDGVIEIEGQSVIDEKTGKTALLVPRSALEAIPDGSVVALMERSAGGLSAEEEEERANRVIVRRRRRGSRRNVRRRVNGGNRNRRRRVNGNRVNRRNQRRRVNRRKNVRVIRRNNNRQNNNRQNNNRRNNRRRRGNRRNGNRQIVYQA